MSLSARLVLIIGILIQCQLACRSSSCSLEVDSESRCADVSDDQASLLQVSDKLARRRLQEPPAAARVPIPIPLPIPISLPIPLPVPISLPIPIPLPIAIVADREDADSAASIYISVPPSSVLATNPAAQFNASASAVPQASLLAKVAAWGHVSKLWLWRAAADVFQGSSRNRPLGSQLAFVTVVVFVLAAVVWLMIVFQVCSDSRGVEASTTRLLRQAPQQDTLVPVPGRTGPPGGTLEKLSQPTPGQHSLTCEGERAAGTPEHLHC